MDVGEARAYEAYDYYDDDTEAVDADEPPLAIALPRVATEDLAVHVFIVEHGYFHRRHPSTLKTSCCKYQVHAGFCSTRREQLVHPLSRDCGCFTAAELAEADDNWRAEFETEPP